MSDQPTPGRSPEKEKLQVRLDISFPAGVDHISALVERVVNIAREVQGESGKELEIGLALTEALANAVKHGCKEDPTKTVQCRVFSDAAGAILIVVRDSGPGFDPASVPSPMGAENIFFDHGRGIHMIRQLMDEVHYEAGGTELHMKKK